MFDMLALRPSDVVTHFYLWQLVTYLFLHGGIAHILFNMLALWMFGTEFERLWGTSRFLRFYFFCGAGAGLCVIVGNYLFGNPEVATVGSSGAIYGILLASAVMWPDRQMLFYFLIPLKMKYFVMIIGAIAFFNSFNPASPVSDVAHLGGMLFGYVFLKLPRMRDATPSARCTSPTEPGSWNAPRRSSKSTCANKVPTATAPSTRIWPAALQHAPCNP